MPSSLIALEILFILLPGFAAAYLVQQLATRKTQTDIERVIEALVFSFAIYVCFVPFNGGELPFAQVHGAKGSDQADTIVWRPGHLGILAGVTLSFALAAVAYIKWDGHRLFRMLNLTERTTRNSIWNDIFENEARKHQIVQVELNDGRSVLGILLYYSDAAEENSLFLARASWVTAEGERIPIPGQGILLTKDSGIHSISLLDPRGDG